MSVDGPGPSANGTNDERLWGMLCHLAALAGYLIPFGHILGPLIVWLVKKDVYPLVNDQGKESLNFQISIYIYGFILGLVGAICIGLILPMLLGIALIFLASVLGIVSLVFVIIATISVNEGKAYRYPMNLRLVK